MGKELECWICVTALLIIFWQCTGYDLHAKDRQGSGRWCCVRTVKLLYSSFVLRTDVFRLQCITGWLHPICWCPRKTAFSHGFLCWSTPMAFFPPFLFYMNSTQLFRSGNPKILAQKANPVMLEESCRAWLSYKAALCTSFSSVPFNFFHASFLLTYYDLDRTGWRALTVCMPSHLNKGLVKITFLLIGLDLGEIFLPALVENGWRAIHGSI